MMTELGANVIRKWSKTIQDGIHIHTIPIPLLGKSPVCPYKALKLLLQSISGEPNVYSIQVPWCSPPDRFCCAKAFTFCLSYLKTFPFFEMS